MAIPQKRLAFIDTETTGLSAFRHEIVEIGCVVVEVGQNPSDLKIIHEINLKVKPKHIETAEIEALRVNGYNEAGWMFACTIEQAMSEVMTKAKDAIMVGQNVSFDRGFIEAACEQTGIKWSMHYSTLDTIPMAYTKLWNDDFLSSLTLRSLCDYFGIVNSGAHTAYADAYATMELFKKIMALK
jgi:DNA polymerase III subunit epsilon